jgi:dihydrofolate reductase
MRKLITTTFTTLDGVMQAPGGPQEDTSGDFKYGGWSFPFWSDEIGEFMNDTMGKPYELVLGRKTYDIFAAFWPRQNEGPIASPFNQTAKYVASRGKPDLSWNNSHLIEGDLIQGVKALKEIDGPELQVHGSGNLIQSLLGGGVIDEMRVIIYPVIVGGGKRLFAQGSMPTTFKVTKAVTSPDGVFAAVYEPVGDVKVGSFAEG